MVAAPDRARRPSGILFEICRPQQHLAIPPDASALAALSRSAGSKGNVGGAGLAGRAQRGL